MRWRKKREGTEDEHPWTRKGRFVLFVKGGGSISRPPLLTVQKEIHTFSKVKKSEGKRGRSYSTHVTRIKRSDRSLLRLGEGGGGVSNVTEEKKRSASNSSCSKKEARHGSLILPKRVAR